MSQIWEDPQVIAWTQILLDSYQQRCGCDLIDRHESLVIQSRLLYLAPFVVVSHGIQLDPVLNYGNQVALELWEMDWPSFTITPSRQTAEPVNRETREQLLAQARSQGVIQNYSGIRISSQGQRFEIRDATVWNLTTPTGEPCGQAATFEHWHFLT